MPFYYKTNLACAGTDGMMDELYDWLTGHPVHPGFPVDKRFTGGVKAGSSSSFTLKCGPTGTTNVVNDAGRFPTLTSGTFSSTAQKLYRLGRGGVDHWFLLDTAYVGNATDNMINRGLFCWITETTGVSAAGFSSFVEAAQVEAAGSPSTVAPAGCWPTFGATSYHFFSNGNSVHVAFKRSGVSSSSWQHFSFGVIDKPVGATWVGGEYFTGGVAPVTSVSYPNSWDLNHIDGWNPGIGAPLPFCSAGYGNDNSISIYPYQNLFNLGFIRVIGANVIKPPYPSTKYCHLGGGLDQGLTGAHAHRLGSVQILGAASTETLAFPPTTTGHLGTPYCSPIGAGANTWNGRSIGVPPDFYYLDYPATSRLQYLGTVPGVRFLDVSNIAEAQTINNDWMCFPLANKTTVRREISDQAHIKSGRLGIAYKLP